MEKATPRKHGDKRGSARRRAFELPRGALRANGQATRARVLAAARASFARAGYEATCRSEVAARAGIDLATLKYHYGDKAALFAEVYAEGQRAFVAAVTPLVSALSRVQTAAELRLELRTLVESVYDYMSDNAGFLRTTLFRLLENPTEVIEQEARLQGDAIALVEAALGNLQRRGIVRPVDPRGAAVLLVTALPTWFLTAHQKPMWLGVSGVETRERFTLFFVDLLEKHLVLE